MMANFAIKNRLPRPVKDVQIRCTHRAPSGTEIDQNTRTIYERFEPNTSKRIKEFNMGFIHTQAERSECRIIGVVVLK